MTPISFPSHRPIEVLRLIIRPALLMAFCIVLVRTAWISDDAAITLRTVLNFINGYGAVFNVDERVQVYTHPLWFLAISGISFIVGNVFFSVYLLSFLLSVLAIWLVIKPAVTFWQGILAASVLMLSKAFVDYSTSGLENPLSHLLLIGGTLFLFRWMEGGGRNDFISFLSVFSLLYLNRPDLAVLVFPLVIFALVHARPDKFSVYKAVAIVSLAPVLWTIFSLFYYGFPFPNTAYAKLGTGIPVYERAVQGFLYLNDSVLRDPVTVSAIVVSIVVAMRQDKAFRAIAFGIVLYLLYVVGIGGDFMSGRLLTAPLLMTALILARARIAIRHLRIIYVFLLGLGAFNANATIFSSKDFSETKFWSGIADERGFYFPTYGLINTDSRDLHIPEWKAVGNARMVHRTCSGLGFTGIYGGPGLHLMDVCGLSDPLMARLPAKYSRKWRVGHYYRQIPTDYAESVETGSNLLPDLKTRALYDSIRLITRGPLFSLERMKEVARMNLGLIDKPDEKLYRYSCVPLNSRDPVVKASDIGKPADGALWNAEGRIVSPASIEILLEREGRIKGLDLSLECNYTYPVKYHIDYYFEGSWIPMAEFGSTVSQGMVRYQIALNKPSGNTSRLRLCVFDGSSMYSLGRFRADFIE